jgi:uncharacterized membrane protein
MIELPTDFTTNLLANANEQITNFSPLLVVVLGLALSLVAIGALIKFLK